MCVYIYIYTEGTTSEIQTRLCTQKQPYSSKSTSYEVPGAIQRHCRMTQVQIKTYG